MLSTELPPIDIEAKPIADPVVDYEITENDIASVQGQHWDVREESPDFDDPAVAALVQWLGREHVEPMTVAEAEALKRSIARLPDPVSPSSFAWEAIGKPSDIRRISEAVILYRRFNRAALAISEAIGSNDELRRLIRSNNARPETTLSAYLNHYKGELHRTEVLQARIEAIREPLKLFFGSDQITIAAAMVAAGATPGLKQSLQHLKKGLKLPQRLDDETVGMLDKLRRHIVSAADKVYRITTINPMRYSMPVLSGVRRSVGEDATGDFVEAIEGLGGVMVGGKDADVQNAAAAFLEYFQLTTSFNLILTQHGLTTDDIDGVMGNILLRRHLQSAARALDLDWDDIKAELTSTAQASFEDIEAFIELNEAPGFSGHLKAVARGRLIRPLQDVARAARKHIVEQQYWMTAAEQVLAVQDDLRFVDLQAVLQMEPEIETAKKLLREIGANNSDDVEELERHLEWMISAYALPIPDEAVANVIETRAEIVPMRLMRRD